MDLLTQERLKSLLSYDPATGRFTHACKRGRGRCVRHAGDQAGTMRPDGYWMVRIDGVFYKSSRLAFLWMTGLFPSYVDHFNLNRADDRWANLRAASSSQNNANKARRGDNKSGFKGVCWIGTRQKWLAQISVSKKCKFLGYFDDPESAHQTYVKAAAEHFAEFARAA